MQKPGQIGHISSHTASSQLGNILGSRITSGYLTKAPFYQHWLNSQVYFFPEKKKILSTVTRSAFKPCVTCAHGGKSVIRRDEAQWLIHLYIPLFYIQKYFSDTLSLAHRLDRILLEDFQVHTGHSKRILVGLI